MQLESAFSLQEHLAALHYSLTAQGARALTRATAHQIAQPPAGIDRTLWLYELCRFLISQCNALIVGFLFDTPPCSAATCPEMRASEWQFLCAVHEQPKSCCAIDYCCHTLDWAANVVSDQNIFPSRFVILSDTQSRNAGLKNLVNVFRRLHRIFAHAWFQHRSVFWAVEGQSGLYVFFKTVCDLYDLLPAENYKLPPEAEGLEALESEPEPAANKPTSVPTILKPNSPPQQDASGSSSPEDNLQPHGRTTTRRHIRSSPSTGSAVTTVMETDEEEADAVTRGLDSLHVAAPSPPNLSQFADEPEIAEVSVVVNDAHAGKSSPRSTETNKADDQPEEAREAAVEASSQGANAGPAVVDKMAEPATEALSTKETALAAPDAPVTDTNTDRVGPVAGHSDANGPAGQDTECASDLSKPSASDGIDAPTAPSTTAKVPSPTGVSTEEAVKEDQ